MSYKFCILISRNRLDSQYQNLIDEILEFGHNKPDRTAVGTKSVFDYTITHCMCDGFPLLTTKKMAVKTMMTELKWFLKGKTNIRPLLFDNCNIWMKVTLTNNTRMFMIMI